MNSLLILPWNWKYFSVYSGRKDAAQLNEGREKDWKQIKMTLKKAAATKGTLASHFFFCFKTLFQTEDWFYFIPVTGKQLALEFKWTCSQQ